MMTERVSFRFDGRSYADDTPCSLQVTLLNRPYADSSEPWDSDIVYSEVSVVAGPFRGCFSTAIWAHELIIIQAVLVALSERVGQEAEGFVDLTENAFDMRLTLTPLGRLRMEVVARGHPGMGPDLHFSMQADQDHLPLWVKQLDAALAAFPAQIEVDTSDPLSYRRPPPASE